MNPYNDTPPPYPYNTIEKNNRKPASIIDIIYTFAV